MISQTTLKMITQHIQTSAQEMYSKRRQIHSEPEVGWCEMQTAATVAEILETIGFEVAKGAEVIKPDARMGLPSDKQLTAAYERAITNGFKAETLAPFKNGFTAVVGTRAFGPGPVVAFRFDMDALKIQEYPEALHFPRREGFASHIDGIMHACGHDGHTAIGLSVARVISELSEILHVGTLKLIFQPAEEGVRGAKAMVESGILDGVDYVVTGHLMGDRPLGLIVCGENGFMASTKLDVEYIGKPAHAGANPDQGANALLAACTAMLNLQAIPRHSEGASRINVGTLEGGTDRNVIPEYALLRLETRGASTQINQDMADYAMRIIQTAGDMHGVRTRVTRMGEAICGTSDTELSKRVAALAGALECFDEIIPTSTQPAGSEDFTFMMAAVQRQGGKACYFSVGASSEMTGGSGHHTQTFDFDERALGDAATLFVSLFFDLTNQDEILSSEA